jgi:hypothetical protein
VRGRLVDLATRHKLPVLYPERPYVEAGGLVSYGSSRIDAFREAGITVARQVLVLPALFCVANCL